MNYYQSVLPWFSRFTFAICTAALVCIAGIASGQDVVMVEEDWELVLGEPDANVCGPQIAVAISPYSHIDSTYFTFEINHRSAPYWTPGGLTIHQWNGEQRVQSFDRADRTVMHTSGETVTWTQKMYLEAGNRLVFEVTSGNSTTWGPFGFSTLFKVKANWNQTHINNYTPSISLAESGVTYAGNRVQSLVLKEIRLTLSDGSVLVDDSLRVAHQLVE